MAKFCKASRLSIVVLLYKLHISLALDPLFQACEAKQCGNLTISYPFYIEGQQESYCGHPGFQVTCNTNNTIISLSKNSYVINKISYLNQTLNVINTNYLLKSYDCSLAFYNLTLNESSFEFASTHGEVLFMQNCTTEGERSIERYTQFSCAEGHEHRQMYAAYASNIDLVRLPGQCEKVISAPYEGQEGSDIAAVLQKRIELRWTASSCSIECITSGGRCIYNQTTPQAYCFCSDGPSLPCLTAVLALVIALSVVLIISLQRRHAISKFMFLWTKGTAENQNVKAFLKSYRSLVPKRYSYTDIKKMTNSFKDRLGEGGYGWVYTGKLSDGRRVAVKVLKKLKGNGEEFINEVLSISRTNHVNVVTLLGFCIEKKKRALIYEFLSNESLEKFLHGEGSGQLLPC